MKMLFHFQVLIRCTQFSYAWAVGCQGSGSSGQLLLLHSLALKTRFSHGGPTIVGLFKPQSPHYKCGTFAAMLTWRSWPELSLRHTVQKKWFMPLVGSWLRSAGYAVLTSSNQSETAVHCSHFLDILAAHTYLSCVRLVFISNSLFSQLVLF